MVLGANIHGVTFSYPHITMPINKNVPSIIPPVRLKPLREVDVKNDVYAGETPYTLSNAAREMPCAILFSSLFAIHFPVYTAHKRGAPHLCHSAQILANCHCVLCTSLARGLLGFADASFRAVEEAGRGEGVGECAFETARAAFDLVGDEFAGHC